MSVMTAQPPLPMATDPGARPLGAAAALVQDGDGGRVFLHGNLVYAWGPGEDAVRRWSAVQLVRVKAAPVAQIAAAFGVEPGTLWRWGQRLTEQGVAALASDKRGPKGPHRLTDQLIVQINALRAQGNTHEQIATQVGIGPTSVRRALGSRSAAQPAGAESAAHAGAQIASSQAQTGHIRQDDSSVVEGSAGVVGQEPVLPVLGAPAPRSGERALARAGLLGHALPVFTPAARVPLAGLFLALPGLAATGLLGCANEVYGALPAGFYGLEAMLTEGVLRTLAGAARAEGATRIDPIALGRVLGLDRAPEVKTIRRKIGQLAEQGKASDLLAALAKHHLAHHDADDQVGLVLYVDGHVRAYTGTAKVAKTHLARLRFPAPATVETWVSDAAGDPVLVVMAQPGASLASELRALLPALREAVGDDRRVLVGFDRGGWSPALFEHMAARGFDVLTWRKGPAADIEAKDFTKVEHTDENGRVHAWVLADTEVVLSLDRKDADGEPETFTMRQVTRLDVKKGSPKQVHMLTTRTDLPADEVVYRMGSRWRQENYFRYARMHFDQDSHDSYTSTDDDPNRSVPNPAKKTAHAALTATRARYERALAATDAALLAARSPAPGQDVVISNAEHDALTTDLRAAAADLDAAKAAHKQVPTRIRLGDLHPGQQVLDTETKLIHHGIRMAAFNTATAIARDIRVNTGYARANHEAYVLARQVLTHTGDIDPRVDGVLTIRLDPMPTARATAAIDQLCQHLTATQTKYPGTDLTLRYEMKNHP